MKNEVYVVLFIYLIVNPTVFASLSFSRSSHLKKKMDGPANIENPPNWCPRSGPKKKIVTRPRSNRHLLKDWNSFMFHEEEESETQNNQGQLEQNKKNETVIENHKDNKTKKKISNLTISDINILHYIKSINTVLYIINFIYLLL